MSDIKYGLSPLLPIIKTVLYFDVLKKAHQEIRLLAYPTSEESQQITNKRVMPAEGDLNVEQQTKEEKL